jgi:hypothetical protein
MSCVEYSASEPLAGTATAATRFLLVEHRGRWGRDALDGTELPEPAAAIANGFDGRVMLVRRPERTSGSLLLRADVTEGGGELRVLSEEGDDGGPVAGPLFLVCTHGRRDRCCARLGAPVYDALAPHVEPDRLWQSSHHGGHRFAPNVLVLPHGIQLGRVDPARAEELAALLTDGRIPLECYRGRTLDTQRLQAADVEARRHFELDRIEDVRPLADDGRIVDVAVPDGVARVVVEEVVGPTLAVSCGAEPEPTTRLVARVDTAR